jgi:hypothetical protein
MLCKASQLRVDLSPNGRLLSELLRPTSSMGSSVQGWAGPSGGDARRRGPVSPAIVSPCDVRQARFPGGAFPPERQHLRHPALYARAPFVRRKGVASLRAHGKAERWVPRLKRGMTVRGRRGLRKTALARASSGLHPRRSPDRTPRNQPLAAFSRPGMIRVQDRRTMAPPRREERARWPATERGGGGRSSGGGPRGILGRSGDLVSLPGPPAVGVVGG